MKLFDALHKACPETIPDCSLNLAEITDLERIAIGWDFVVFARMMATEAEFEKVVGIPAPKLNEFDDNVFFVKHNKIIYTDRRTYHPEIPFDQTYFLGFHTPGVHVIKIPRSRASFHVSTDSFFQVCNIVLDQMWVPKI